MEELELTTAEETTDAETLLNQALEEKRLAEEKAQKREDRFKKTAKQLNEAKAKVSEEPVDVNAIVSKRLDEEMYYFNNPVAKEFKNDIEALKKANNLSTEDAYTLFLAKNKPELLNKATDTSIDWVSQPITKSKDINEMSLEELDAVIKTRERG